MKKFILDWTLLFFFLLAASCGGMTEGNQLTEVGNPPATGATASATTKALTQATTGLSQGLAGLALTIPAGAKYVAISMADYECTLSTVEKTLSCECPQGGSFLREFDGALSATFTGTITLDRQHETTFTDCAILTCGETVTLNGTITGEVTGTVSIVTDAVSLASRNTTAMDCAGMLTEDGDFGFDMALTLEDGEVEFSGNICVSDNDVSFDSIADLREQVDPDGECEDFGP